MIFFHLIKEKQLYKKIAFTIMVLAVAELLAQIPVFGVNASFLQYLYGGSDVFGFMNTLSGGSVFNLSMASFGIISYITACLAVQLISVAIPRLENIRQSSYSGQKLFKKIEFILAMVLSVIYSFCFAIGYGRSGLLNEYNAGTVFLAIISWVAGAFIIIFLGTKVEDYGIGNGISLILAFNILSRVPDDIKIFYSEKMIGSSHMFLIALAGIGAVFVVFIISMYLQCGTLNIPIKQSRKSASSANEDGIIPISTNIVNILPVIYASTLISLPAMITTIGHLPVTDTVSKILSTFTSSNWYEPTEWYHVLGIILYILLITLFGFYGSNLTFNAAEVADQMKKNGNVIPGVNPGEETVAFFEKRRKVMVTINIIFLYVLVIVPGFICAKLDLSAMTFLGSSMLIVVSVMFDEALRLHAECVHKDKRYQLFT